MFNLWIVLLTYCCLCGAQDHSTKLNQIHCLYERFNSSVTFSKNEYSGVWHIVRAIPIVRSTLSKATNPDASMSVLFSAFYDEAFFADAYIERGSKKCKKLMVAFGKNRTETGDSFYVTERIYQGGTTFESRVYPLFIEANSTAVVWFSYDTPPPHVDIIFVLSRFHNETRRMDQVEKTLHAFCPYVGPAVRWHIFPTTFHDQAFYQRNNCPRVLRW